MQAIPQKKCENMWKHKGGGACSPHHMFSVCVLYFFTSFQYCFRFLFVCVSMLFFLILDDFGIYFSREILEIDAPTPPPTPSPLIFSHLFTNVFCNFIILELPWISQGTLGSKHHNGPVVYYIYIYIYPRVMCGDILYANICVRYDSYAYQTMCEFERFCAYTTAPVDVGKRHSLFNHVQMLCKLVPGLSIL